MIVDRRLEDLCREEIVVGVRSGSCQEKNNRESIIADPSSVADHLLDEPLPLSLTVQHDCLHETELDDRLIAGPEKGATSNNERLHSRRRTVRFETDKKGRIVETVFLYRAISERCPDRCYLSREALQRAVTEANAFAEKYASVHEDWHPAVEALLLTSSDPLSSSEDEDDPTQEREQALEESTVTLAGSSARGLEFTSPLLQKHQVWANRSILRRYRQLAEASSVGVMAERIGDRCRQVNRPSRRLAREMARGDEVQARLVYQEDDTWNRWKGTTL
jgi:hypothetical protein